MTGLGLPGEAPYDSAIQAASAQWGVPADLLAAQLSVESSFNPSAVSKTGAQGIAQFEPGTAKAYGVDVHSPASSINGEAHYMADLRAKRGSWDAALQAYSGDTAGYAAKIDALVSGHGGNLPATGGTSPAASGGGGTAAGDTANALTVWLDSASVRVGLVVLGGALLLLGLRKAVNT